MWSEGALISDLAIGCKPECLFHPSTPCGPLTSMPQNHPMRIAARDASPRIIWALEQAGVHPLLARLFAARGVRNFEELDDALTHLAPPNQMLGSEKAAHRLADALQNNERVCVVADYDCDGATACAVATRGLKILGMKPEQVCYVVPDRAVHGYGLTSAIVDLALAQQPQVLLTVDNGIASLVGVAYARQKGLSVIITDHHLPALLEDKVVLPDADVIVNPNQPECAFPSKNLAGVGVVFYVLMTLRTELRNRGLYEHQPQPRLDVLLDLVALGTVADVVKLDANNRRLVSQGLKRIRSGKMQPGIAALFTAAGRRPERASGFDFGFALGPRLNAAGRLSDMTLGIECLSTDDPQRAKELAELLDKINHERKHVEGAMREQAELLLEQLMPKGEPPAAISVYDADFHEGVVGIVASRLKDRVHRPTFVFAKGQGGVLKGSGRSISGFHLRDALDMVSKRHPELLKKFGGHAMAAGCTLGAETDFDLFQKAFNDVAQEWLAPEQLQRQWLSDGSLDSQFFTPETVRTLEAQVWGQAFEPPLFCDEVEVVSQRLVGEKHLKLAVKHQGFLRDAIWFGHAQPLANKAARLGYRLSIDEFNGRERVQMIVECVEETLPSI
jgi:single-stranded-DNA-specific exonuclease